MHCVCSEYRPRSNITTLCVCIYTSSRDGLVKYDTQVVTLCDLVDRSSHHMMRCLTLWDGLPIWWCITPPYKGISHVYYHPSAVLTHCVYTCVYLHMGWSTHSSKVIPLTMDPPHVMT